MRQRQITNILVVMAAVLAVAATTAAGDDRDFMHEVAAAPNIIFILDTSSSMVGSPETANLRLPIEDCDPEELVIDTDDPPDGVADEPDPYGCSNGLKVPFTMVPAGGDDPYSRMGIAKSVLKDFLEDVGEANVAFAGYAQDQPTDGSHPIWKKNWVYEARAQDRFHMVDSTYAYRLGYSENHAGVLLDVPADILKRKMIGYKLYFDPESTPLNERFGPTNAYDTGYLDVLAGGAFSPLPYDLMPIYFGNCYIDESDGSTVCMDNVFPFFDGGTWYYGQADESVDDYPGCNPTDAIWDDGFGSPVPGACENEWEEESGVNILQYQRRVRLEIPTTYSGSPNYYLASDGLGGVVGNDEVPDTALNQDYDLDGFGDPDYDGSETSDWILYVNSVEEQQVRTCAPSATLPTWTQTPTYTPTFTETFTPTYTPTPIVDCSQITVTDLYNYSDNDWRAKITNQLPYELKITHTKFTWVPYSSTYYVDYFNVDSTGRGVNYTYWGYDTAVKDYGPVTDVDTDLWVDPPDILQQQLPRSQRGLHRHRL